MVRLQNKLLFIFISLLLLISTSHADDCTFNVQFVNSLKKKVTYTFWWVDHPFDWPGAFNVAGGELEAEKSNFIDEDYSCGTYMVKWSINDTVFIYTFNQSEQDDKIRILKPN